MKSFVTFLSLFCFVFVTQAQHVSTAVVGGVNLSKIKNYQGGQLLDHSRSFHLGAHFIYSPVKGREGLSGKDVKWGAELSIMYSREGEAFETPNDTFRTHLDFINVPVYLTYQVIDNLTIQAGPQAGFLINADNLYNEDLELVSDDFVNSFSLAFSVGLGYDIPDNNIFFRANLTEGLTDLFDNQAFLNNASESTRLVRFTVGYKF